MRLIKEFEARAKEQEYYYRLPYVKEESSYLNYDPIAKVVFYDYKFYYGEYQTRFTKSEYAAIAKEKNIPEGYHIEIEVTDDE